MKRINKGLFTAIAVAILLLTGCHDTIDITKNSNENPVMDSTIIISRDENTVEISDTTTALQNENKEEVSSPSNEETQDTDTTYNKNVATNQDKTESFFTNASNNTPIIQTENNAVSKTQNTSNEVWIPQTGKKYHSNPSCSGMNNPSKVSLTEAESLGFTACKRCH
jgi:uncharacterized protein YcfL